MCPWVGVRGACIGKVPPELGCKLQGGGGVQLQERDHARLGDVVDEAPTGPGALVQAANNEHEQKEHGGGDPLSRLPSTSKAGKVCIMTPVDRKIGINLDAHKFTQMSCT